MPIVQTGLDDINIILGHAHSTTISMNDEDLRDLAEVASGEIGILDLTGKPKYSYLRSGSPQCYWDTIQYQGGSVGDIYIKFNDSVIVNHDGGEGYHDLLSYVVGAYTYLRGGLMQSYYAGEGNLDLHRYYSVSRYLT